MADLTEHTAETDVTNVASRCLFLHSEFKTTLFNYTYLEIHIHDKFKDLDQANFCSPV